MSSYTKTNDGSCEKKEKLLYTFVTFGKNDFNVMSACKTNFTNKPLKFQFQLYRFSIMSNLIVPLFFLDFKL